MRLVIASNNAKKRAEIETLLSTLGIEVVPVEQTNFVEVEEDGETFAANAEKKARAFAQANHLPALADDSGLEVEALDGRPGVYSSRYAGPTATDAENNAKLLMELSGVPRRTARFVCVLHLAFPDAMKAIVATGTVEGTILLQPSGSGGFGYDPLFFCPVIGKSFAEASPEEKNDISHRAAALRNLMEKLAKIC